MDTGYADVNGLHMYYEVHGDQGTPLVLLHGGVMTFDNTWSGMVPALAQRHRVVGVEFQAHGHTADIDRDLSYANLASDVVGLLDHLGIDRAHVMGHSMGGGTTLELAVHHGDRLLKAVPISASVRPDGAHPDLSDPSKFATSTRMPTEADFADMAAAYARVAPHPEAFDKLPERSMTSVAGWTGWTDEELAGITAPTLIVLGDHDFTTTAHGAVMQELIPGSQLAIVPGATHMQVVKRTDVLLPILAAFLLD